MTPVKNIIFDLGNVLYDIDFDKMYAQFDQLGIPNFQNHFTLNKCDQLFYDLEKGFIDQAGFCEGFNQLYKLSLSHVQIITAWNLNADNYNLIDQLYGTQKAVLKIENGEGTIKFRLDPLASYIFKVQDN